MYYYRVTIYNDGDATVIHEPSVDPTDPHLYSCSLTQGQSGEIDSLQFTILPNNPGYELLNSRTTLIEVTRIWVDDGTLAILGEMILGQAILGRGEEETVFSGRVLTMTPEMEENGLIYKTIVCEERLGYLCDSIQPYLAKETYWGNDEQTGLEQYLTLVLDNHNSQVEDYKKIYLGNVTFHTSTDNITKGLTYESTWSTISSKLLSDLGGEIQLREGDDGLLYLDYVDELGEKKDSPVIEFARNMKSISCEVDPTEVITRLIPLGASLGNVTTTTESDDSTTTDTEDGDYLTIAEVNDGVIYLDDVDAQEKYGIVEGVVQWQDVTQADNLLTKAKSWLATQSFTDSVTLSAVDLNLIGIDANTIERNNYYRVINEKIGLDDYLRVIKKKINICDPSDITYELGGRKHTLSGTLNNATTSADNATKALLTTSTTFALKEAAIYTEIENSVATIKSDIEGEYVKIVTETDEDGNIVAGYSTTGDIYNAITQTVSASENTILSEISTKYATTSSVNDLQDTVDEVASSALTDSVTEYYKSTSATELSGGEWTTDTPTWEEGTYIWIRTTITTGIGDSTVTSTSEPVCITGNTGAAGESGNDGSDGASVTISSSQISYQASDSGLDAPTGNWLEEIPGVSQGQYLWTKTTITYTLTDSDGVTTVKVVESYSVAYIGTDGEDGKDGTDGTTYYTWIKYADDANGTNMSDNPEGKLYMGIAYNQTVKTEGTDASAYTWALIKGEDGSDGVNGVDGDDGITYYTWVKYADDALGTNMSDDPTDKYYIGLAYNKETSVESTDASDYSWSLFRGSDGVDGTDGSDGRGIVSTAVYYAVTDSGTYYPSFGDDGTTSVLGTAILGTMILGNSGTWLTEIPEITDGQYLWTLTVFTYSDGTIDKIYTVSKAGETGAQGEQGIQGLQGIQGEQGEQGIQGEAGEDGKTSYFHIKYSEVESPTASDMTETPSTYIGTYVDYTEADSTDPADYTWVKWIGEDGAQGIAGTNGTDGKTYYLHIAYANSEDGATDFSVDDSTDKSYIGQYTDTEVDDSTDYTKYAWTKIKGEDGADGKDGADGADGISVESFTAYYAVSESATYYPSHGDDGTTAVLGVAVLGAMILGNSGQWYTEQPDVGSTEYLWGCFLVTYSNGLTAWTEPFLLTNPSTREAVEELEYSLTHNYSTTTEVTAAIEQAITESEASITSEIAKNYVSVDTTTDSDGNTIGNLTTTLEIYNTIQQLVSDSESSISLEVSAVKELVGDSITAYTPYYAVSTTTDYYPSHGDDGTTSVLGTAVLGKMVLGNSGEWTTEQPTVGEGEYCWICYYIEYASGETEWTEPTLLTDNYARTEIDTLTEQYASLVVDLNSISASVTQSITDLETNLTETIEASLVLEIATDSDGNKYGKLSANADYIEFSTGDLIINSSQFTLDADGNATFKGNISGASGTFSGELAANIVTASNIQDAAVTNAAIAAAAVTNSSIATGAVTYDKISVSTLSAISADVGTLTAGIIQSSNYVSGSAGVYIDLTNGTAEFNGDVHADSFSLDGTTLSVVTTSVTESSVSTTGTKSDSTSSVSYLKLSTSTDWGLVADTITATYFGANTAYITGLFANYVNIQNEFNCEDITVRNDVTTWYIHARTGYFTVGLSVASATIDDLTVNYATNIGTTLGVTGDITGQSNLGIFGNATINGIVWYGSLSQTSDSRLKNELETLDAFDGFFDSLKPGRFQYTYGDTEQYHTGMYAQDVLQSLIDCGLTESDIAAVTRRTVSEDSPSYHGYDEEYGLNYTEFIALLIDQMQKLKTRVATLEKGASA